MSKRRNQFLKIHKYLGISTGLVVFIVSITGALWVFKEEIEETYEDFKTVEIQDKKVINAFQVEEIAQQVFPKNHIHGAIFGKKDEAIEVVFYDASPRFYQSVFLNPYTGKVLHVKNNLEGFFAVVLDGHKNLWLPEAIGSRIVGYSVLLFLIILISGLVLWWPKNKRERKRRLKFNWKKKLSWRRKAFDLHAIFGFYVWSFAWVFAFTGCIIAFNWFYFLTYIGTGGNKDPRFLYANNISKNAENRKKSFENIHNLLEEKYPDALSYEIHYPTNDSTSILVENVYTEGKHYNIDYLFFDQNTLEELEVNTIYGRYKNTNIGDKVIRMNYDLHTGALFGITGKIIMFLAGLFTASLPITGILIWLGRRKSRKNKRYEKLA